MGFRGNHRWHGTAASGYDKHGSNGLSAGIAIAVKEGVDAMFPGTDHDGLTKDPMQTSVTIRGDT